MVLMIVAVLLAGWVVFKGNPETIEQPVYLEKRIDFVAGSRIVHMVLFAKTPDHDDCNTRARKSWEETLQDCKNCKSISYACQLSIKDTYAAALDGATLHTTFLRAERGNRFERSGIVVLWGLTQDESDRICGDFKGQLASKYSGKLDCVRPAGL